jgi:hypothetical protein
MDDTQFRKHGYQVFRGVLEPTVVADTSRWLAQEANNLLERIRRVIDPSETTPIPAAIAAFCETGRHHALDTDLRNALSGHFPLAVRTAAPLQNLIRSDRLLRLLSQIFPGQSLRAHMPPMARFVLPENGVAAVPPHQDISYNRHLSDFVTVWVPLVPIDDRCGGVAVYHGTRELPEILTDADVQARDIWLKGIGNLDQYPPVHYHMQPGDVLVFEKTVVHASMPNTTDRMRLSLDYRFFGSASSTTKHYLDMDTWSVIPPGSQAA